MAEERDGVSIGKTARARIADLEQTGQITLWNGLRGLGKDEVLSGELLLYKQGFDVTAVEERLDQDDERFKLVTFKTDGKSKPVEGALYFAIIGDHLGLIQSNAVTGRWLERYLTWLLKDITGAIDAESVINLDSKTSFDKEDLAKFGPAKSLVLHAAGNTRDKPLRELRERARGKGGTVFEVLELLGVGEDTIESIRQDIPEGGKLEGDFLVYIKDHGRKKPISVGTLNHAFRNSQPGDIDVERRGSKVRDNLSTLSEPVRVQETALGLNPDEAMEEIVSVLYKWAERSIISFPPPE